ncbi:MAG: crotonase/enoyl-CoA hydratase family protein [Ilumatobacteraceae bacterium]
MSSPAVTTERRDGVLICHIDDGKANALSAEIIAAISDVVLDAERDETVSALVLHGRPGKFSAGFDLSVMTAGDIGAISSLVSDGGDLVRTLYGSSIPVVAACTGHALAAGALVLLGCDVRVGADVDCKIGLNEVAIGMVLPDWAFTIAVDRLSKRHIQRAVATARITSGAGAVDAGYLDEIVPVDSVLDVAVEHAAGFASLDLRAYAGTVRRLRGDVLDLMETQIAADRSAGRVPGV